MSRIKESLRSSDIRSALEGCRNFSGVYPADCIPNVKDRPISFVINTDKDGKPGKHWIALLLKLGEKAVYMDPLGFPPLEKDVVDYVTRNACNGFKYSSVTLQDAGGVACGYYCVAFIHWLNKGGTLNEFIRLFNGRFGNELKENDAQLATFLGM